MGSKVPDLDGLAAVGKLRAVYTHEFLLESHRLALSRIGEIGAEEWDRQVNAYIALMIGILPPEIDGAVAVTASIEILMKLLDHNGTGTFIQMPLN